MSSKMGSLEKVYTSTHKPGNETDSEERFRLSSQDQNEILLDDDDDVSEEDVADDISLNKTQTFHDCRTEGIRKQSSGLECPTMKQIIENAGRTDAMAEEDCMEEDTTSSSIEPGAIDEFAETSDEVEEDKDAAGTMDEDEDATSSAVAGAIDDLSESLDEAEEDHLAEDSAVDVVDELPGNNMSPETWQERLDRALKSCERGYGVEIDWNGEPEPYAKDKVTVFDFNFTSSEEDQGTCVVQWRQSKYMDDKKMKCKWRIKRRARTSKPLPITPEEYSQKLKERREMDARKSLLRQAQKDKDESELRLSSIEDDAKNISVGTNSCSGVEVAEVSNFEDKNSEEASTGKDDNDDDDGLHRTSDDVEQELSEGEKLDLEIKGIDRKKWKHTKPARYPSYIRDAAKEDAEGDCCESGRQERASFSQLLGKEKISASQMAMVIVRHKEVIKRPPIVDRDSEDQRDFPNDQEWIYEIDEHLRLAQIDATELDDGSFVISPNDDGKYDMTFFIEDPDDEAKPREERRWLYELHRFQWNDKLEYFGQVEPSHKWNDKLITPYTVELDIDELELVRVTRPFLFDRENVDEWAIPRDIWQDLKEVQEATGLDFGPLSKKSRKRHRGATGSRSKSTVSGPKSARSGARKRQHTIDRHLSAYDRKVADQMLIQLAESFTSAQLGSRASTNFVYAVASIIEVNENGHRSTLLREKAYSRKGGNETHAEQYLLDDLYSSFRPKLKKTRQQIAEQYMILLVVQNMEHGGVDMDGSLCGSCVCALNMFQRRCGLKASMLKVITPRMEREDQTGKMRSTSVVAKIRRRYDKSDFVQGVDLMDVEYVPCLMNSCSSSSSNQSQESVNETNTIEKMIQDEQKARDTAGNRRKEHMPCCSCSEVEKHIFEI